MAQLVKNLPACTSPAPSPGEDICLGLHAISEGRGTQRGEENALEGNILAGEAASQAGDSGNEAASKGDGSDVSSQTPQTSSDWPEQVHLV